MKHYHPIEPARLDWKDNTPHSQAHGDIYFSSDGGPAETEYVFLQGNRLPERWLNQQQFTIAETGFGTGLNFLCTIDAWLKTAPTEARLNFISVEKHPLTKVDLERALSHWPELTKAGAELLEHYPPLVNGLHQRRLFDGRVTLTLMFGDATEMFSELNAEVDAWFLDGFAPSKNPEMWNEQLLQQIARLAKPGGSFATFTAAGIVRRGLQAVGFEVSTQPGFGRKRDMSVGTLVSPPEIKSQQPWFKYSKNKIKTKQAIVIGAGLAGCTVSHSLAQRGWQVTLIERHNKIAQEASGNHAGVAMPRLTADMSAAGRFYLSAFLHTVEWLNTLKQIAPDLSWFQSGVLQLCDEKQQRKMAKLGLPLELLEICDAATASRHCGVTTQRGGLFFPTAGWLEPPALCQWLLNDQGDHITTLLNQSALQLKRDGEMWQVLDSGHIIATAETVIITNGYDAERLLCMDTLALQKVRGQLAYLAETAQSQALKTPICYDGYIIPSYKGQHCCGASYDIDNESSELSPESETEVLSALTTELPQFKQLQSSAGRVAYRTSSQDHLPLIGPVPDINYYQQNYSDLHHGKPANRYPEAQYLPNLFISTGHGSRGLVSCPLAAETIAALINNETSNLTQSLTQASHPGRFLIRRFTRRG